MGKKQPATLAVPFHLYDPKSLRVEESPIPGQLTFGLAVDPVNKDAVQRQKVDLPMLDVYSADASKGVVKLRGRISSPAPSPGDPARTCSSSSSAGRASPGEAMSYRSTTFSSVLAIIAAVGALGCSEVRGRKRFQEANELYKRGRYQEAVAAFESAEALVPNLPTLWLNKGYTCRQLIAPGGRDPESRRAANCALDAFQRLAQLSPNDRRADQLTVQTWFDIDDFPTPAKTLLERIRRTPDDYDVVHGLQEVYYKWGKWPQALEWSTRAVKLRLHDAEAHYGVGTFIWQILGRPRRRSGHGRRRSTPAPAPAAPGGHRARRAQAEAQRRRRRRADPPTPPPPPPPAPGDVTGKARVELADQAIAELEKAVALRPHHADAMTYLALVWRQKSFGLFAEPAAWQLAVDRANEWQKRVGGGARREELTMAFEAFRAQSEAPARAGRKRLWYARLDCAARRAARRGRRPIRSGTSRSCRRRCSR